MKIFEDSIWIPIGVLIISVLLKETSAAIIQPGDNQNGDWTEVDIDPFQLKLEYDDGYVMSTEDGIFVLRTMHKYLSDILESTEPAFSYLSLYHFLREDSNEESTDKIAFAGTVYLQKSAVRRDAVQEVILMSLVGENMNTFISKLVKEDAKHMMNAKLLSADGNYIGYVNGNIVVEFDNREHRRSGKVDRKMRSEMKMLTAFLSFLLPGLVFCVACSIFFIKWFREVNWERPKVDPDKIWHRSEHYRARTNEELRCRGRDKETFQLVNET